jgi:hypothetical protein
VEGRHPIRGSKGWGCTRTALTRGAGKSIRSVGTDAKLVPTRIGDTGEIYSKLIRMTNLFLYRHQLEQFTSIFQNNDSALYRDCYGVRPIVGTEFSEDCLHMSFDSFFRDRKMRGNDFVSTPCGNLPQHFQFAFR